MTMTKQWTSTDTIEALAWLYPWLAVEPGSGADVIDARQEWYDSLVNAQHEAEGN